MAEVTIAGLPFAPQDEPARVAVRAHYFAGQVDAKRFRAQHRHLRVLAADPLVVEPAHGSFAVLMKYGALALWNMSEAAERAFLEELAAFLDGEQPVARFEDSLEVVVGTAERRVTFHEIWMPELRLDHVAIISRALCQSVALEAVEQEVAAALAQFSPVVAQLGERGRLTLKPRDVIRAVGFALSVRQQVLANLTLFDRPPETWESESLERLDSQLYDFFDLEERVSAINQKVAYFSEMNATLTNLLHHRKSVRLEWIIILLIFIEVVFFVWVELFGRGAV